MCSSNVGIVGVVKKKLNSFEANEINFISVHCILHQEALCNKSTNEGSDGFSSENSQLYKISRAESQAIQIFSGRYGLRIW